MKKYKYGKKTATVRDAKGVRGMLIRGLDGHAYFRVAARNKDGFIDYIVRHDDMDIVITDQMASFYTFGSKDEPVLDHSPRVLGLKSIGAKRGA